MPVKEVIDDHSCGSLVCLSLLPYLPFSPPRVSGGGVVPVTHRIRTGLTKFLAFLLIGARNEGMSRRLKIPRPPDHLDQGRPKLLLRNATDELIEEAKKRSFSHQVVWIIKRSEVYLA